MYIFWTMAGIILLALELTRTNIFKLTFASSFLFCAVVAYKAPENYVAQLISFLVFSFVFYFLIKLVLKKEKQEKIKLSNLEDFVGKTALVKKDIGKTLSIDGLGSIEFENELWSAKSVDDKEIKAGQTVQIVSRENMILNVKVMKNADK